MDIVSEAGSESRHFQLKPRKRDEELRGQWSSPKGIPKIASEMQVKPGWVRARATRLGLEPRDRSAVTDWT